MNAILSAMPTAMSRSKAMAPKSSAMVKYALGENPSAMSGDPVELSGLRWWKLKQGTCHVACL